MFSDLIEYGSVSVIEMRQQHGNFLNNLFLIVDTFNFGDEHYDRKSFRFLPAKWSLKPDKYLPRYLGFYPKIFINISTEEDVLVLYVTHSSTLESTGSSLLASLHIQVLSFRCSRTSRIESHVNKAINAVEKHVMAKQELRCSITTRRILFPLMDGETDEELEKSALGDKMLTMFEMVMREAFYSDVPCNLRICGDVDRVLDTRLPLRYESFGAIVQETILKLYDHYIRLLKKETCQSDIQIFSFWALKELYNLFELLPDRSSIYISKPGLLL